MSHFICILHVLARELFQTSRLISFITKIHSLKDQIYEYLFYKKITQQRICSVFITKAQLCLSEGLQISHELLTTPYTGLECLKNSSDKKYWVASMSFSVICDAVIFVIAIILSAFFISYI